MVADYDIATKPLEQPSTPSDFTGFTRDSRLLGLFERELKVDGLAHQMFLLDEWQYESTSRPPAVKQDPKRRVVYINPSPFNAVFEHQTCQIFARCYSYLSSDINLAPEGVFALNPYLNFLYPLVQIGYQPSMEEMQAFYELHEYYAKFGIRNLIYQLSSTMPTWGKILARIFVWTVREELSKSSAKQGAVGEVREIGLWYANRSLTQ